MWLLSTLACTAGYEMPSGALWREEDLPLSVRISGDFEQREREIIERSAATWSEAVGGSLLFFEISDEPAIDPRLDKLDDYLDDLQFGVYLTDELTELDGLTRWRTRRDEPGRMKNFDVFVDTERDVSLELLVTHELGHALGLKHISGAPAVMTETFGWPAMYTGLKKADIDAINWLYGTDPDATGPDGG